VDKNAPVSIVRISQEINNDFNVFIYLSLVLYLILIGLNLTFFLGGIHTFITNIIKFKHHSLEDFSNFIFDLDAELKFVENS
jgi:hypothetical protein